MTKFLLDSGNPQEYKKLIKLAKENNSEIWGATTNPTLIAQTLAGKKFTPKEAFNLQKEIVMEILSLVPGAVSAEVYADHTTNAEEMIEQGEKIASWDKRIYVKLPTTHEAFKARTALRKKNIPINNTLVFSQPQIFAISLHEQIIRRYLKSKSSHNSRGDASWAPSRAPGLSEASPLPGEAREAVGLGKRAAGPRPSKTEKPQFISPFIGRLEDHGEKGMHIIKHGMKIKDLPGKKLTWMLAASVRTVEHIKQSIDLKAEIITAPAKTYLQWFNLTPKEKKALKKTTAKNLKSITRWKIPKKLEKIASIEEFMEALQTNLLDIRHPLTDAGLKRFAADWKAILTN